MRELSELIEISKFAFSIASFEDDFGSFNVGFFAGITSALAYLSLDGPISRKAVLEGGRKTEEIKNPARLGKLIFEHYEETKRGLTEMNLEFPPREIQARTIRRIIEKTMRDMTEAERKGEKT